MKLSPDVLTYIQTVKAISIVNKSIVEETQTVNPEENIFIDMRGLSKICLN